MNTQTSPTATIDPAQPQTDAPGCPQTSAAVLDRPKGGGFLLASQEQRQAWRSKGGKTAMRNRKAAREAAEKAAKESPEESKFSNGKGSGGGGTAPSPARLAAAEREARRVIVPGELEEMGLSALYRELVRLSCLGDRQAAAQVIELSGLRDRVKTPANTGESAGVIPTALDARSQSLALLDVLGRDVGGDITPDARRLVAELDMGIGEVMRRGMLGLPLSELEQVIYDQGRDVCRLRRLRVDVTPQGMTIAKVDAEPEGEGNEG